MISNAPEFYEKPAVLIYWTPPKLEAMINAILWGLEEEGIPARLQERQSGPVTALAKDAANSSMLNVGIAMSGTGVVLHHRDLPPQGPLFYLGTEQLNPMNLRLLGANAARLVKVNPLIVPDGLASPEKCKLP